MTSNSSGTDFNIFKLSSYTTRILVFQLPAKHYRADDSFTYFSFTNNGDVYAYKVAHSACNTSEYFDSDTGACSPCLSSCATCLNNKFCLGCPSGKTRDSSGLCVDITTGNALETIVDSLVDN